MNKKKYITAATVFLLLSFLVVTIGLYLSDALPDKITYAIDSAIDQIMNDDGKLITQTGTDVGYVSLSRPRIPAGIHGAYIDLDTELAPFAQDGTAYAAFIAETESNFDYLRNFMIDTLFITPDYVGAAGTLTDANGNKVDVLNEYLKYADLNGCFKVLVINDSCIYHNGQFSFDTVKSYLRNYSFDAVLLSSAALPSQQKLASAASFFGKHVKVDFGGNCYFGVDVPSSAAARYADADTLAALESGFVDFAVVEGNSMKNAALPFSAVMNWWNAKAQVYPDITFYCRHRNDLVLSNTADWNNYIEICDQVRFLWNCENFKGSVFYNLTALKQNVASASVRLSYLYFDGELSDLSVNSIQLNENSQSVLFTGTAAAGYKVLCNGKNISNLPSFTYSATLTAGENDFVFFSAGKSLHYRIYNNTRIIYDYAPQTDLNVNSGDTVMISAVCMEGADVCCAVNGKTYVMSEEYAAAGISIPEGYRLYACGVRFSGNTYSDLNLGKVVIAASVGENTETVTGACISVLKSESRGIVNKICELFSSDTQVPANTDKNPFSYTETVSPYHDNGLGRALLCRIVNDDTEILGALSDHDTYHADYSTLPEGTIDYVKSMTLNENGYLRYELKSGISVYGVNCELINNGYALPKNRVFVNSVDDSSPRSTDIVFNMDWFSPVTVKCCPQEYFKGYQSYAFNISAFTAQYIDVTFHYTGDFYNSSLLNFDAASPFSRSELYAEGDENLILRLYLKKPGQFYGFDLYRNEQNQLVLSCKKHVDGSLQGKVVMLDAGHGGLSMTGTALADNSVAEKTVTLAIAYKTKQMLEMKGAQVLMTRTMDTALSLEERTKIQSSANPDIFVSIHCDGTDNIADAGTHTFYFRPYSQPLANAINTSLTSVYQTYIYVPTDTNYAKVDKSIKFYPFFVTRLNHCPSVLVETGFMTNPVEGQILASDNAQYWIAKGISDGVEAYFANNHV